MSNTTINSEGDTNATNPTLSLRERLRDSISVTNCVSHNSVAAEPPGTKSDLDGSPVSLIPTKFNLSKKVIQLNDVSVNAEMPEMKVSQIFLCRPPSQPVTWKQVADMPDAQLLKQHDNSDEEADCVGSHISNRTYAVDNFSIDSIETTSICKDEDSTELHFDVESAQKYSWGDRIEITENQTVSLYAISSDALSDRNDPSQNKILENSLYDENPELPESLETTVCVDRNEMTVNYSTKTLQEIVSGAEASEPCTLVDNDADVFKTEEISDNSTPVKEEFFVEIPKVEFKNIEKGMRTNSNTCRDPSTENAVFDTGSLTDLQVVHDGSPNYGDCSLFGNDVGDNESQYGSLAANCLEGIEHCPNSEVICDTSSSTDNNSLVNADKNNRELEEEVYRHCSSESEPCTESSVDFTRQGTDFQRDNQNDAPFNCQGSPLQLNTKDDLKLDSSSERSQKVTYLKKCSKEKYKPESFFKCKKPKLKCKKTKSCTCGKSSKIYKCLVGDWKLSEDARSVCNFRLNANHNYEFSFNNERNKCACDTDSDESPVKHCFLGEVGYKSNDLTMQEDESSLTEECQFENCDGSVYDMNINKECVTSNSYIDRDLHFDNNELSDTVNEIVYDKECDCIMENGVCYPVSQFCDDLLTSYKYIYVDSEKCEAESNSGDVVELAHSQVKALADSKPLITTDSENIVQENYLGNDSSECMASEFSDLEPKVLQNPMGNGTFMSETTIDHKTCKEFSEVPWEEREQYMDSYKQKQHDERYINMETRSGLNDSIAKEFTKKAQVFADNSASTHISPLAGGCSILDEEVDHSTTANEVTTVQSVTHKADNETEISINVDGKDETAPHSAIEKCSAASNRKRSTKSKKIKSKVNNAIKLKVKKKQTSLTKAEKPVAKKLFPVTGNEKATNICGIQRNSILNSEPDSNHQYVSSMMNSLAFPTEFHKVRSARETEISSLHSFRDSDFHHRESAINRDNNFSNKEFKLPAIVSNPEKDMGANNLFPHHDNTADETSKLTVSQYDDNKLNKPFLPVIGVFSPLRTSSECNELNAQCFTALSETRGHEGTHHLCVTSKIPRPLFNKQICKSNSQVMKVHHLPSLDTSLVKLSRSENYPALWLPYFRVCSSCFRLK